MSVKLLMQQHFLSKLTGSPLFVVFLRIAYFLRGSVAWCVTVCHVQQAVAFTTWAVSPQDFPFIFRFTKDTFKSYFLSLYRLVCFPDVSAVLFLPVTKITKRIVRTIA